MERAISYITVMPDTKAGIQNFVDKVLAEVEARQSLHLLVKLTAMEEICKQLKDGLKEQLLNEADLTGEKSFTIDGNRFEKRSRATYHYHNSRLHEQLKAKLKQLEDVMKTIKDPMADTETGEIIPPALTSFTDYIAVTLKKE